MPLACAILWLACSGCYLIKGGVVEESDDTTPLTQDMGQPADMSDDLSQARDMARPVDMSSPDEGMTCSPSSDAALCASLREDSPGGCGEFMVEDACTREMRAVTCGCVGSDTQCIDNVCVECQTQTTAEVCGNMTSCDATTTALNGCGEEVMYDCSSMCGSNEMCQDGACVEVEVDLCEARGAECGAIYDGMSQFTEHCGNCLESRVCSGNRCIPGPNKCPGALGCGSATQNCACDAQLACVLGMCKSLEILPDDVSANTSFGEAIALFDDLMIVGASRATVANKSSAGAAYVFRRDQRAGHWVQTQKLVSNTPQEGASFGTAVATDGKYIAVGARDYDGLDGMASVDNSGRVEIFERQDDDSWAPMQTLESRMPSAQRGFGRPIAFDEGRLYVGASSVSGGSVLVFELGAAGLWGLLDEIQAPPGGEEERFGYAFDILGDWLVVGASATAQMPSKAGQAFVYKRGVGSGYEHIQTLTAFEPDPANASEFVSAPEVGDEFGGEVLILGTPTSPLFVVTASGDFAMRDTNKTYVFNLSTLGMPQPIQILTEQRYTALAGRGATLFAASGDANNAAGLVDIYRYDAPNKSFVHTSGDTFVPPEPKDARDTVEGRRFGHAIGYWGFGLAVSSVYRTTSSESSGAVYFMDTLP